jgi:hypothetical protein
MVASLQTLNGRTESDRDTKAALQTVKTDTRKANHGNNILLRVLRGLKFTANYIRILWLFCVLLSCCFLKFFYVPYGWKCVGIMLTHDSCQLAAQ